MIVIDRKGTKPEFVQVYKSIIQDFYKDFRQFSKDYPVTAPDRISQIPCRKNLFLLTVETLCLAYATKASSTRSRVFSKTKIFSSVFKKKSASTRSVFELHLTMYT